MPDTYYTHAMWKVKAGREAEFVEAWKALSEVFLALPHPPGTGMLIQSAADPTLYYSFGPWASLEDIQAMRSDAHAQAALQHLRDLCVDSSPGTYRVIMQAG